MQSLHQHCCKRITTQTHCGRQIASGIQTRTKQAGNKTPQHTREGLLFPQRSPHIVWAQTKLVITSGPTRTCDALSRAVMQSPLYNWLCPTKQPWTVKTPSLLISFCRAQAHRVPVHVTYTHALMQQANVRPPPPPTAASMPQIRSATRHACTHTSTRRTLPETLAIVVRKESDCSGDMMLTVQCRPASMHASVAPDTVTMLWTSQCATLDSNGTPVCSWRMQAQQACMHGLHA
jgi:hypothetical protein